MFVVSVKAVELTLQAERLKVEPVELLWPESMKDAGEAELTVALAGRVGACRPAPAEGASVGLLS